MHPFARYIQILGKGRNGSRSLTREQAYEAMQMITCYSVEPEQVGAFLMLMRVKEETAEEVAGFTQALRESLPGYGSDFIPAVDWAAYAGKKRQLPWFLLAALILAGRGYPVFMHGMNRSDDRVYVPLALDALDMDTASSFKEAREQLRSSGFAYLPISKLSPLTTDLLTTREIFGLRPPMHTVARMLNPFSAPLSVIGVFHPNYAEIHQRASLLLGQANALVCKGEGGEFERIPDRLVEIYGITNGKAWQESWQGLIRTGSSTRSDRLNLHHFRCVWDGEAHDPYGEAAVTGTLAMLIRALGIEVESANAHRIADEWWQQRHHTVLEREAS